MRRKKAGVITLEVELKKPLDRKNLVRIDLRWDDMLDLPISGDVIAIDRFDLKVVRGPVSDEALLDQPQVVTGALSPGHWYCHYDGDRIAAEKLITELSHDPRYLDAQVLT
ncbi:hypothetical protein ACFW2V_12770 [Streptomyces sp. NPDC058947]|uniref:hypothetical protein n=1 Tax=Streptomyces sp. NPDC058947 TaxID=3346675 RepID=UPI0036AE8487